MKEWAAHFKIDGASYEVSVCYGDPNPSWGWFGRDKIRVEDGYFADARARAEKIAAALNAAAFDPTVTN